MSATKVPSIFSLHEFSIACSCIRSAVCPLLLPGCSRTLTIRAPPCRAVYLGQSASTKVDAAVNCASSLAANDRFSFPPRLIRLLALGPPRQCVAHNSSGSTKRQARDKRSKTPLVCLPSYFHTILISVVFHDILVVIGSLCSRSWLFPPFSQFSTLSKVLRHPPTLRIALFDNLRKQKEVWSNFHCILQSVCRADKAHAMPLVHSTSTY